MARLGYRPHTAARGMRGQTYTLGVHLPNIHNPFFTDIMAGMNSALERTQYQTLVGISQSSISTQQALMDAIPRVGQGRRARGRTIAGDLPSPLSPPSGCAFHPRCPKAQDICKTDAPVLLPAPGRAQQLVACHFKT